VSPEMRDGVTAVLFGVGFSALFFFAIRSAWRSIASSRPSYRPDLWIDPQDNPGLLLAAMRAFEGTGQISFEGIAPNSGLWNIPGASPMETEALRRAIIFGTGGFVVLPLTHETIDAIGKQITWEAEDDPEEGHQVFPSNFFHVQIASDNRYVFGAYDNFCSCCVVATKIFPREVLDRLVANGIIRSYTFYRNDSDAPAP
jgi:hypothetical protein